MKLAFLGAARQVTGSSYFVETDGLRILVDCGLYQERSLARPQLGPLSQSRPRTSISFSSPMPTWTTAASFPGSSPRASPERS